MSNQYHDWITAKPKRVMLVNDTLDVMSISQSAQGQLGDEWEVVGCVDYESAAAYLEEANSVENPKIFAVISDQCIPAKISDGPASASADYGDKLVRMAAESAQQHGLPCLIAQWTMNSVERVSEGPGREHPIFIVDCQYTQFPALILTWLNAVKKPADLSDLVQMVDNDASLREWLIQGEKAWVSTGTQKRNETLLRKVHDSRHNALSSYFAVYSDIQNIDYWRSDEFIRNFGQSESRDRIDAAIERIATNTNRVLSSKSLPQIGGLLVIEITLPDGGESRVEDYLKSGVQGTLEPVVIDDGYSVASNEKNVRQAMDDALQAEKRLNNVCVELADQNNANEASIVGQDKLGGRFEQHFEDLKQSLGIIVQFFESRFRGKE